jgi:hypothetical protein
MDILPITIHKSWFGYLQILVVGLLVIAGVIGVLIFLGSTHGLTVSTFYTLGAFGILFLLLTIIQLYVYGLTTVVLTTTGITVTNWTSLLTDQDSELDWTKVQDVASRQDGFFPEVIGYGTLLIQTAGADKSFEVPMIPDVDHWVDVINKQASATPQLTHNV